MSLFFGSGQQLLRVVSSTTTERSDDSVTLGRAAWDALIDDTFGQSTPEGGVEKFAIVIRPAYSPRFRSPLGLSDLVEWAVLDDSVIYNPTRKAAKFILFFQVAGVRLPSRLKREYPWLFPDGAGSTTIPPPACRLQRVTPAILSEVVLLAKSPSALYLAQNDPERIRQWFCSSSSILRHHSTYSFEEARLHSGNGTTTRSQLSAWDSNNPYEFEIAMTQPVLQGIADASRTSFVVTSLNPSPFDSSMRQVADEDTTISLAGSPAAPPTEYSSDISDADGIEIGEGFLANSVPPLSASRRGLNGSSSPLRWMEESSEFLLGSERIPSTSGNGTSCGNEGDIGVKAVIFLRPQPLETAFSQGNILSRGDDPEAFAYISSSDLGRLGLFSGDWVRILFDNHTAVLTELLRFRRSCRLLHPPLLG